MITKTGTCVLVLISILKTVSYICSYIAGILVIGHWIFTLSRSSTVFIYKTACTGRYITFL